MTNKPNVIETPWYMKLILPFLKTHYSFDTTYTTITRCSAKHFRGTIYVTEIKTWDGRYDQ